MDHSVHAGDADGREQSTDRCRDQADQQGDEHGDGDRRPLPGGFDAVEREGQQGDTDTQEDDRESRQQDVQGDLIRRFLALGALNQADHAVQKSFPGVGSHLDH